MPNAYLSPPGRFRAQDNNNAPLINGQLFTYAAGTTTPIATYTDSTAATANPNPVILNARGEAPVWLLPNTGYKFILQDSLGNEIWTDDNIFNLQYTTPYIGVDIGQVNTYIVNGSAAFQSYSTGIQVFFIAANSNTGASTLDVNGLGAANIVNPNGSALSAGQILSNQMTQAIMVGGNWILTSVGATTGNQIGTFGPEVSLASASITDLGSTGSHVVNVTGVATITSFGSSASTNAPIFCIRFSGTSAIIYNATSLITPTSRNITVSNGDACIAEYLGSGNWKILFYQSVSAIDLTAVVPTANQMASSTTLTPDPNLQIAITATGTYIVRGWINDLSGTSSGGLKGCMAYTGSSNNAAWAMNGVGSGVTTVPLTAFGIGAEFQSAQAGTASMNISGILQATSIGTLSFEWAQQTSNATPSIVGAGSWIEATYESISAGSFSPVTHIYNVAGSGTETIPTGATTLTIEVWGASAGGLNGSTSPGLGGGSGGYSRTVVSVSGSGGHTLNYTVGTAGGANGGSGTASSVSSGTFTITTMTANGGTNPNGGTATGGTAANTTGNAGTTGIGGAGITGLYDTGYPGGGSVFVNGYGYLGLQGLSGIVLFRYA